MRVLLWYCERFSWVPTMKTLEEAEEATSESHEKVVVAFVHVEPNDVTVASSAETKLVKNTKWLARKWKTKKIILHSFSHLAEEKADPGLAKALLDRAAERIQNAGYETFQTPYGYFNNLELRAPGHPLARLYKSF